MDTHMNTQGGSGTKEVILVMAIGEKYLNFYNNNFRESHERFAKKINRELVVLSEFIESFPGKYPAWQRLLMFRHPKIAPYDKVLMIDADIYITRHARNPFEVCGDKPWGVVHNNPYNLASLAKSDLELYAFCPKENRPNYQLNLGMYVISKQYQPVWERLFYESPEQPCYENGPLSYFLINEGKGMILPPEFNTLTSPYREAFGNGLSTVIKMYDENSFIHFAGGIHWPILWIIRYIDTHQNPITKLLRFLGQRRYDKITEKAIESAHKLVSAYNYHIKKRFSKLFA
jgi:hypothetical protein